MRAEVKLACCSFLTALLAINLGGCSASPTAQRQVCGTPISEFQLRIELAKHPYFAQGVPPPGKVMEVERWRCGYSVHVGEGSAQSLGGDTIHVDANGQVLQIINGY